MLGKRVRCPACEQISRLPSALPAAAPAPADPLELTDESEPDEEPDSPTQAAAPAGKTCPKCEAAMAPEAVLCVQCGFNLQSGDLAAAPSTPKASTRPASITAASALAALAVPVLVAVVAIVWVTSGASAADRQVKDLLSRMMDAANKADADGFAKCFAGTDVEVECLGRLIEIRGRAKQIMDLLRSDHPNTLTDADRAAFPDPVFTAAHYEALEDATLDVSGDETSYVMSPGTRRLTFIKIDGDWYIVASGFMPAGTDAKSVLEDLLQANETLQDAYDVLLRGNATNEAVSSTVLPNVRQALEHLKMLTP